MHATTAMIFVNSIIEAGGNIQAVGDIGYVIAAPLPRLSIKDLERIEIVRQRFGPVDHLNSEIVAYLRQLGRIELEIT